MLTTCADRSGGAVLDQVRAGEMRDRWTVLGCCRLVARVQARLCWVVFRREYVYDLVAKR